MTTPPLIQGSLNAFLIASTPKQPDSAVSIDFMLSVLVVYNVLIPQLSAWKDLPLPYSA